VINRTQLDSKRYRAFRRTQPQSIMLRIMLNDLPQAPVSTAIPALLEGLHQGRVRSTSSAQSRLTFLARDCGSEDRATAANESRCRAIKRCPACR
jgi:hypothetical protein